MIPDLKPLLCLAIIGVISIAAGGMYGLYKLVEWVIKLLW
jgi:hypothetical protein